MPQVRLSDVHKFYPIGKVETTIFSTHDRMVMDFARRLIQVHDGRIIADERLGE